MDEFISDQRQAACMGDVPTLDAAVFRPICDSVEELGGDVAALMEASGLTPADPAPDVLPEAHVWEFFDRSAAALDLPQIGLVAGDRLRVRDLGSFGRALENCVTLHDCLRYYRAQVNAHSSHARFWFHPEADGLWFCRGGIDVIDTGREYVEQFTVQLMIRLIRLSAGPAWLPERLDVQTQDTSLFRSFESFGSDAIRFGRPCTAVWIPHSLLIRPLRRDSTHHLLQSVRNRIARNLEQKPRIDSAAAGLGCSRRTLQRILEEAGLTWSVLVSQVRVDTAMELLAKSDERMIHIAERLGYTDPSNFSRAFVHWTGVSPRRYRQLNGDS